MGGADRATDVLDNFYHRQVGRVVAKLRQMADEIEGQRPVSPNLHDMKPDYASHASDIVHKVQWGTANLPLESVIRAAADADRNARSEVS